MKYHLATLLLGSIATKLFYDAFGFLLFEAIVAGTISAGGLMVLVTRLRSRYRYRPQIGLSQVFFSVLLAFNLLFFSLMMVDRSKSLYVIRWVGDCPKISEDALLRVIREELGQHDDEYLRRRFAEQKQRQLIDLDNLERLELTFLGQFIFSTSEMLSAVFGLDGWSAVSLKGSISCNQ